MFAFISHVLEYEKTVFNIFFIVSDWPDYKVDLGSFAKVNKVALFHHQIFHYWDKTEKSSNDIWKQLSLNSL